MSLVPCTLRAFALVSSLASLSFAGDWYVDAVGGNDANGGGTPQDAWRTLRHAVTTVPVGTIETIHVAPGTYGAAIGEVFPLVLQPQHQLVADGGPTNTVIDGGGTGAELVRIFANTQSLGVFDENTLVRGFALQNAARGIVVSSSFGGCRPTLENLSVRQMSIAGVAYSGVGSGVLIGSALGVLRATTIEGCAAGVEIVGAGGFASPAVEDCLVRSNLGDGIRLDAQLKSTVAPTLRRVRSTGNGLCGVRATYAVTPTFSSGVDVVFEDCLIAENTSDGFDGVSPSGQGSGSLLATFRRSTIVQNGGIGVRAVEAWFQHDHTTILDSTIVARNGDDILENGTVTATACAIEDGDFAGQNGNIGGDPQFADSATGDWRLRWGSPCIESGAPVAPGTLDLLGHARPIDGNLDTLEAPDRGAFEFEPLHLESTGQLGSTLKLELWGTQGNASTVYFARFPLTAPQATPFGEFELAPNFAVFRVTVAGSGPPKKIVRTIPNLPSLIGSTFSFQALTTSAAAPQGAAYSNGVQLTLLP